MATKILVVCGTNRPRSRSMAVCRFLKGAYEGQASDVSIVDLADLPPECFLPGAFGEKPGSFAPFQKQVLGADGLHLVVPEYNGSFPGILKHFIDLLEYPASFQHRPVAFTGLGHQWGGLRPVEHLGQVFGYRNSFQLPERVMIQDVKNAVDHEKGILKDDLAERLRKQTAAFMAFIKNIKGTG